MASQRLTLWFQSPEMADNYARLVRSLSHHILGLLCGGEEYVGWEKDIECNFEQFTF